MSGGSTPESRGQKKLNANLFDISGDPNVHRHESGSFECKLCLTVHANANSYLTHAAGRRHQGNLAPHKTEVSMKSPVAGAVKKFDKIGLPQYNIVKVRDPRTLALGIRVEIQYTKIKDGLTPQFRLMSAFEQQIEEVDTKHQYLVIAAEPYETVALRIPAKPVDETTLWSYFDKDTGAYTLQLLFHPGA